MASKKPKLKVISLGGLQEIGKNMTVFEYDNDIIIVDCGLAFPEDDMLGIDLVIPDISYLVKNMDRIRGIVLTHGHEDHIGALPYVLKEINVPVFGTLLTLGLLENKLKEHGINKLVTLHTVVPGEMVKLGQFKVEFIHTNHSIADAVALAITTPVGVVVHTGDFKVDYTPIDGGVMDLHRFAELGKAGVLLLLSDSTNAERKGFTMSESSVGGVFDDIFSETPKNRIMVATFSSNIHRIQQIVNSAYKYGRKVAIIGRSMVNAVKTSIELDYLNMPDNTLIDISEIKNYTDDKLVIITTGSQGETMSALSRIASNEHKQVSIRPGDKIIISASSIPGNEKNISNVINELMRKGADVVYDGIADIHVSGHARQEELKLMLSLVKPKYFMPVHGEYVHLLSHRDLALSLGIPKENIFVMNIGEVLEISKKDAKVNGTVPSGQVLVDGLGVGDVGNIVLRDRRNLSENGLMIVVVAIDSASGCIVSGPDIISRGFVYVRESEDLMDEAKSVINDALMKCEANHISGWSNIKNTIKDTLKNFLWQKMKRSPMILPIIMEV
ncbi:ribonuclease J [Anaerotignum sp. MSJ-24]|uniref:ribonuclease J n=1 Tax=Anaerotignum sp. MSJ-24 TaxID=2841521 RepID=UPI001C1019CF|nr:ribonuclease J [Anaerotignum sp. MSJ-24]MBD9220259.1 ribonuclease J [Clostridiales bacterium]MBU5464173.1 ribonuclease J [Anaerotignum sp. MSJ-24]